MGGSCQNQRIQKNENEIKNSKRIEKFNPDLIIFLVGANDWNSHIVKSKTHYIFTNFEINYNVKNSILYKSFKNIKKQIIRKISIITNYKDSLNKDKTL